MKINFNSKSHDCKDNSSLLDFLKYVNILEPKGIALAVNQKIVSKSKWNTFKLQDNDTIIVVKATQGG
jgi:sulfur carrier protein